MKSKQKNSREINITKGWYFQKIYNIDKSLATLTRRKVKEGIKYQKQKQNKRYPF